MHSDTVINNFQPLEELLTKLQNSKKTDFFKILQSTEISKSSYEKFSSWSLDCYTRNCIHINEEFELMLLCWEKEQQTPIHDHGGEECWVKVIEGNLKEIIYNKGNDGDIIPIKTSIHKTNSISYMVDFMGFHSLKNMNEGRTITLHLYAKPIQSCQIFNKNSKSFVHKKMDYNTRMNSNKM